MSLFTVQMMVGPAGDLFESGPKEFSSYGALSANLRTAVEAKIAHKVRYRVTINTHGLATSHCAFANLEMSIDLDFAYKIAGHYDPIQDLTQQLKEISLKGKVAEFFHDTYFGD